MIYINEDTGVEGRNENTGLLTVELTIGLAIAAYRGFPLYFENQKNKIWVHSQQRTLHGKNIAIIGNGRIAQSLSIINYLYPQSNIVRFSRTGSYGSVNVKVFLENIHEFDVIIIAATLNDSTENMFNKEVLAKIKDGGLLVNISKGEIVNTEDLIEELHKNRIFAALDQTYPEKLPQDHPLWDCPNLIITPHIGSNAR